ncbi:MAG: glutathione peroxidase, partial [Candidatus Sericytochromatia bacterium]
RVLLIVNTASKCGLTPQYEGLEKLHATYAKQGLSVLGFPSNDFFGQEPGSNAEIQQFCQTSFGVTFDMFEKLVVKGRNQAPLYRYLTATAPHAGEVRWNFEKFLIGRDGRVVARFEPRTQPTDKAVVKAIEAALAR